MPCRLVPCDLGDPGWESLVSAWYVCCFAHLLGWPGDVLVGSSFASSTMPS